MADYDPMDFAVPKMDDDSPADMSTVFNDIDVTEVSTLTMMVTVATIGTTRTPTPVTTFGTIPSTSADGSTCIEGTVAQELCQDLKVYS